MTDFDVDNAGTAFRFLTALFAIKTGYRILTGSERMAQRPIAPLVNTLNALGAKISYPITSGFPPILIHGTVLQGGKASIRAHISSQFVSALLLIAPTMEQGLQLELKNTIASQPYIQMTLDLMRYYGIAWEWNGHVITIYPQKYRAKNILVEADWSAAAFWYEIVALSEHAEIELMGLQKNSWQGDAKVAEIYEKLGVQTHYHSDSVVLTKTKQVTDFLEYDFLSVPDLFPSVAACCTALNVPFTFTGLQNLNMKESERVTVLIHELMKFGFQPVYQNPATVSFAGFEKKQRHETVVCDSHNDHRIAMALAPLCIMNYNISLTDAECVKKSYPNFFTDLQSAGFFVKTS